MKRLAILGALAACGGRDVGASGPTDRAPRLQLLQCTPATAGPMLADDGVSFGGVTKAERLEMKRASRPGAAKLPRVIVGTPTASVGGLDAAILARVLRGELDKLRACYDRELATSPQLAVRIEVAFTIGSDGRVTQATAGAKVPVVLGQCLSRVIANVRFPAPQGGGSVHVTYPLAFDHGAPGLPRSQPQPAAVAEAPPPVPWTPYSLEGIRVDAEAVGVAHLTERAVREKLDAIGACFTGPAPSGSLRVMLAIDPAGTAQRVRVGGLADPASEGCVTKALSSLIIATSSTETEVACDLSRGDAQRWRLTAADYEVITTTATSMSYRGTTLELAAGEPDALPPNRTYLILVQRDTPGTVLEAALAWAFEGDATLIALAGEASVLLGTGRSTFALGDPHDDITAVEISFEVDRTQLAGCVRGDAQAAPLADATAMRQMLARLAARCRSDTCASTVGVTLAGDGTVGALAEVIDAVRHAGFSRMLIGGGTGCRVVKE